jgi:hypothetical protein
LVNLYFQRVEEALGKTVRQLQRRKQAQAEHGHRDGSRAVNLVLGRANVRR